MVVCRYTTMKWWIISSWVSPFLLIFSARFSKGFQCDKCTQINLDCSQLTRSSDFQQQTSGRAWVSSVQMHITVDLFTGTEEPMASLSLPGQGVDLRPVCFSKVQKSYLKTQRSEPNSTNTRGTPWPEASCYRSSAAPVVKHFTTSHFLFCICALGNFRQISSLYNKLKNFVKQLQWLLRYWSFSLVW